MCMDVEFNCEGSSVSMDPHLIYFLTEHFAFKCLINMEKRENICHEIWFICDNRL